MKCQTTILPHLKATIIGLLMFEACSHSALASRPWSGKVIYDVQPMNAVASEWDYLPQTITYETNGDTWRITEQGTSFERIWIGEFDAPEFSVLFHFLGHAVELLEFCLKGEPGNAGEWYDAPAPCAWPVKFLPKSCVLTDGPASYRIVSRERIEMPIRSWSGNAFELPKGYEPMDRLSLSALLSSLSKG